MDAAQTNFKKTAFLLAIALVLLAPLTASAQNGLQVSATTVTIGNTSCNEFQNIAVTSSVANAPISFTVAVNYPNGTHPAQGDSFGNWLEATVQDSGATSTGATFLASTGNTGTTLTVILNSTALGLNSDKAQVILTDTNNASDTVTITVFYQETSSCGGNTGSVSNNILSITPGNVALTTTQTSQSLAVTNETASAVGFTVSAPATTSGNWLSATATNNSLAGGGSASVTVSANAANATGTGTLSGTVYIQACSSLNPCVTLGSQLAVPVTFALSGSGGGGGGSTGTLTLNGATSNTYATSFNYIIGGQAPGPAVVSMQDTAANANSYSYTVTTSNNINWLQVNYGSPGPIFGSLSPGSNASITVGITNAANTLASGAYQGTVTVTSGSGSTATITVNLYVSAGQAPGISVSPGLIFSFQNVAAPSSITQTQSFSITASSGVTLGVATASNPPSWLTLSTPSIVNNGESFTVTANSNGLAANIYSATIVMTSTGNGTTLSGGNTYITVVLPVGQPGSTYTGGGGTSGTSAVAPLSIAFQQQLGNSYWTGGGEAQNITIAGPQGTQWSTSISYGAGGANWLNIDSPTTTSGTFGTGPVTLALDLFNGVTSLAASNTPYTATLTVTVNGQAFNVAVSVLVTPSGTAVLLGKASSATFTSNNGSNPSSQTVSIVGSDNTGSTNSPNITAGSPSATWISVTTSGNTMTISANPSGLSTGIYSGAVPVMATNTGNYPNAIQYPVVLVVNGGGGSGSGALTLNPPSISFPSVTATVSTTLGVTASSSTSFTVTSQETNCLSQNWLTVGNGSYTATGVSTAISVAVSPAGIANGTTCNGVITLQTSTGAQTVNVSMTVGTATAGGNVTVTPSSLQPFAYTQGQAVPAAQTVTIVNTATGTASIPFTVATAETNGTSTTWLQTNVTSAQTPYNNPGLSISVAPGTLPPNTYTGTVTITPNGGTAVVLNVTMTITGNAVVSASPTSVTLNYTVGSTLPTSTVQVSGGGAQAGFTAAASSTGGWLAVSPTSGTTPNTGTTPLTVSLVATALASLTPGNSPYSGMITVAATSPATGTTNVQVTLNVTAPLPVIAPNGVTNEASFAYTGSVSPGEIISLFSPTTSNNPIGPSTPVQLNAATCPNPCTSIPTTMGNVQVLFLPGRTPAPLLYVSASQINAIVPYQLAGQLTTSVEVVYLGQSSNAYPLSVTATSPGLYTANESGAGPALAQQFNPSGTIQYQQNLPSTPASVGWTLTLFVTGEGVLNPAATTGSVTSTVGAPPQPVLVPTVLIGNQPATVSFYAEVPGVVSGFMQINVIVPAGAGTGQVPVSVSLGTAASQKSVTVSLQ